jgi:excisionase family DNA binding protein
MAQRKTTVIMGDAPRHALSVFDIATELGVSEQLVRLEIARAQLKATRFGRRIIVTREALDEYLAEREQR